jgi:hypothetical protein
MLTLTSKLSLALLATMLGAGCASQKEAGGRAPAGAAHARGAVHEEESLGIEITDASFVETEGRWYVTGQLKARRPLPPSLRRVQIDIIGAQGDLIDSKTTVARSYGISAHAGRNTASPALSATASFRFEIPAPSTFDHVDIKIARGATAKR